MDFITILIVFGGLLVGFSIGSNDAGNCMGPSVGAGVIDYKKALYIVAILAFVGAFLQGGNTISTMGKGLVDPTALNDIAIASVLLGAGLLVILFSVFGMPVSATMAVIGAVAGVSALIHVDVLWGNVSKIFFMGFLTPIIAAVISFIVYRIYLALKIDERFLWMEKLLGFLVIVSGGFLAYSLGANNVGNAMGLIMQKGIFGPAVVGIIGGLAIAIGAVALGRNVMTTVGRDIIQLSVITSFTSQLGAAITMFGLTLFSIPTSSTFAIVGAIFGSGLVKGMYTIEMKVVKEIVAGWVTSPLLGAIFAAVLFKLLTWMLA